MDTATRGNAAEAAVLEAFVQRGFGVLLPFGGGRPYDLVVELPSGEFLRVQCKTAWRRKGCLLFNARSTDHGRGRLLYLGLADAFGVYAPTERSVYLLPVEGLSQFMVSLRVKPALNNQKRGVRLAEDYLIDRWTTDALSQLVSQPTPLQLAA
jgi:PD-(D/E)XK nuclease superfamily protein